LLLLFLTFFAVVYCYGKTSLAQRPMRGGTVSNDLYIPAVAFAVGWGFQNFDSNEVPQVREFLNSGLGVLETPLAPPKEFRDWEPYEKYNRYLIYTVGVLWRIFGISWEVARALHVVFCAWAVGAFYLLSRLLLRPVFAVLVTMVGVLILANVAEMNDLRDFSKVPFLFTAFLLLGLCLRGLSSRKALFVVALGLGATVGIGLGFRHDLTLVIPAAALVFFLMPPSLSLRTIFLRGGVFLTCLATFLIAAWPILNAFSKHGSLFAHHFLMGQATECDLRMNLEPASYDRIYRLHDVLVSFSAHAVYPYPITELRQNEDAKTSLVRRLITTFPADTLLTRPYASVLAIIGESWRIGLSHRVPTGFYLRLEHIPDCLLWAWTALACITLIFFAPQQGIAVLLCLLYFLGYPSILFQMRHYSHLYLLPILLQGWLLSLFVQGVLVAFFRKRKAEPFNLFSSMSFKRRLLPILLVPVVLLAPYAVAIPWQYVAVKNWVNTTLALPTKPVPVQEHALANGRYFSVPALKNVLSVPQKTPPYTVCLFYLRLTLRVENPALPWQQRIFYPVYKEPPYFTFTFPVFVRVPPNMSAGDEVNVFVPIFYEDRTAFGAHITQVLGDFCGFYFPDESGLACVNISGVENLAQVKIPAVLAVPSRAEEIRWMQTPTFRPDPRTHEALLMLDKFMAKTEIRGLTTEQICDIDQTMR
jgi:hypothetical protein